MRGRRELRRVKVGQIVVDDQDGFCGLHPLSLLLPGRTHLSAITRN